MVPIVSIVGRSDSGKTTLIVNLIPVLINRGLRVGTIKHDVHGFEMDHPGKDSWRHKQAGSSISLISSPKKIGMVMDVDHDHTLDELAPLFPRVDIILAEGYKRGDKPKIEIFRPAGDEKPLGVDDNTLIALVTDTDTGIDVPSFATDDSPGLVDFLVKRFSLE
ncbi:molybdopterin-guanine dinucleotide biosynthesis protein B [Thermodesulfobacteriota bacterium]